MKRIAVSRWVINHQFSLIHPSGKSKEVSTRSANLELDDSLWIHKRIITESPGFACGCDFIKIAYCVGAYARLWIGELDGTIAPMDVPPEGWTYPSGMPVEPQWFWQWFPSEAARTKIQAEIDDTDPLSSMPQHFKRLVPYQLARNHGVVSAVEAIELPRLLDFVRPDVPFLFESEN